MSRTAWVLLLCVLVPVVVAYFLSAGSLLLAWLARRRRGSGRTDGH
jgi:hypothetical protein